ncbi:MAG: hypothetical protein WAL55_01190 [Candidatus Acidiferrales bacterium]
MQLNGKLTQLDLNDVQKTVRSKKYWAKVLFANWYGILLLAAVIWATISGMLGYTNPNWRAVGIMWAVVAAIVLFAVYKTRVGRPRVLTKLNSSLPDYINLANDGVKLDGPNEATSFIPWRNFKGWREGQLVVLIDQTEGNRFVILPVGQLSEIERQQTRQLLQSQIPPIAR